jgi:hypothetical protein
MEEGLGRMAGSRGTSSDVTMLGSWMQLALLLVGGGL